MEDMDESEFYSSYLTRSMTENFELLKYSVSNNVNLYTRAAERGDVGYLKLIHKFVESEEFWNKRWSSTIFGTYNPGNRDENLMEEIDSPMMAAIKARRLSCVKFLCEIGRSADLFDESLPGRITPFMLACEYDYSEILFFILSSSDVNCPREALRQLIFDGTNNRTLLFRCSSIGNLQNIKLLLELHNLPIEDCFDDSNPLKLTPFMISCFNGHAELVEYFIVKFRENSKDLQRILDMRNHEGRSASHLAATGYIEDLKLLGEYASEEASNSVLSEAVCRHLKVLNVLSQAGCDFRAVDNMKDTPLFLVVKLNDLCSLDILRFLTSTDARDELKSSEFSRNPFFYSLYNCDVSCVQHLSSFVPKEIILEGANVRKLFYRENLVVISWFVSSFLDQSVAEDLCTEYLMKCFLQSVKRNDEKMLNLTVSFYKMFDVSSHATFDRWFKQTFLVPDFLQEGKNTLPIIVRLVELGLCLSSNRAETLELYRKIRSLFQPEKLYDLLRLKLTGTIDRESELNLKDMFDFYKEEKEDILNLLRSVLDGLDRIQRSIE